jgi:excisionase family DNA binding protein
MSTTTPASPALTVTVDEAAQFLGISRRHAYNAVASGDIPSIRIGKRVLVPRRRLFELLEGASGPTIEENGGADP